jgi:hypothetical protein
VAVQLRGVGAAAASAVQASVRHSPPPPEGTRPLLCARSLVLRTASGSAQWGQHRGTKPQPQPQPQPEPNRLEAGAPHRAPTPGDLAPPRAVPGPPRLPSSLGVPNEAPRAAHLEGPLALSPSRPPSSATGGTGQCAVVALRPSRRPPDWIVRLARRGQPSPNPNPDPSPSSTNPPLR